MNNLSIEPCLSSNLNVKNHSIDVVESAIVALGENTWLCLRRVEVKVEVALAIGALKLFEQSKKRKELVDPSGQAQQQAVRTGETTEIRAFNEKA